MPNAIQLTPEPQLRAGFKFPLTDDAVAVSSVMTVIEGDSTPSVEFIIKHAANITDTGTTVLSDTTTNATTGEVNAVSVSIPADDQVWVEFVAVSGAVRGFTVTLSFGD
jgi:hypothetical protein